MKARKLNKRIPLDVFNGCKAPKGYKFVMNGTVKSGDMVGSNDNDFNSGWEYAMGFIGLSVRNGRVVDYNDWHCARKFV